MAIEAWHTLLLLPWSPLVEPYPGVRSNERWSKSLSHGMGTFACTRRRREEGSASALAKSAVAGR